MFTIFLYILAIGCLIISFIKSKQKTKKALLKAVKSFENILPQFLSIIIAIGIMLSVLDTQTITKLLGDSSGILGVIIATIIGSITLIPGFVAFPLVAALFESGAGVMQVSAFVSALTMVGIVTLPLEMKTFGKKVAITRNVCAFIFSFFVAFAMGVIL
ncbi:MAG: permease [Eubacteriales bacterium]